MNKNVEAFKKYYANATKEEVIEDMFLDNCNLQERIDKAIEYNNQIIKDTKSFYRPTEDTIYSGDTLIELAERNIEILRGEDNE